MDGVITGRPHELAGQRSGTTLGTTVRWRDVAPPGMPTGLAGLYDRRAVTDNLAQRPRLFEVGQLMVAIVLIVAAMAQVITCQAFAGPVAASTAMSQDTGHDVVCEAPDVAVTPGETRVAAEDPLAPSGRGILRADTRPAAGGAGGPGAALLGPWPSEPACGRHLLIALGINRR